VRIINCDPDTAYRYCLSALDGAGLTIEDRNFEAGMLMAHQPGRSFLGLWTFTLGVDVYAKIMPYDEGQTELKVLAETERLFGVIPWSAGEFIFNESQEAVEAFSSALDFVLQRRGVKYLDKHR
jgi:hypothetical protein